MCGDDPWTLQEEVPRSLGRWMMPTLEQFDAGGTFFIEDGETLSPIARRRRELQSPAISRLAQRLIFK